MSDNTIFNFGATENGLVEYELEAVGFGQVKGVMQIQEARDILNEIEGAVKEAEYNE